MRPLGELASSDCQAFSLVATKGTQQFLAQRGIEAGALSKVQEGSPNAVELLRRREISFVINTTQGRRSREEITAFDSTGLAIQDLAIALAAVERAGELELSSIDL